ncbi:GYDIA family GHMP kinase [Flavobacterium crassostreae]|uniref:GHMP kinase n=1 Tax=Flavobacterium crassostreae TaxID=1763534 RepID=A0A1B9DZU4_9FLAO|nr:GYDIA family GHMP kinase [Flavobacterium crassostreae]OCB75211.1 GHMP kinase [Flavobacterium crassostreae]
MKKTYYSNGKLLITGEYLVLDGAKALALPTKFGQNLIIEKGENQAIYWKSYDVDQHIWFEDSISFASIITPQQTAEPSVKTTLTAILHHAYLANPRFIDQACGYQITTQLTFPRKWGLGTSSTLINNIAQWLQIDAFKLLNASFGGSGYDIACAQHHYPITYQLQHGKPKVVKHSFVPSFSDQIYFVYLNQKQSSKTAIAKYRNQHHPALEKDLAFINAITTEVLEASKIETFEHALEKHESKMSHILQTSTIKELLFADFEGQIKSLGAWGGDFVMVTSKTNPIPYFQAKGYPTVLSYQEMILT